jgi:hypothetical protein
MGTPEVVVPSAVFVLHRGTAGSSYTTTFPSFWTKRSTSGPPGFCGVFVAQIAVVPA